VFGLMDNGFYQEMKIYGGLETGKVQLYLLLNNNSPQVLIIFKFLEVKVVVMVLKISDLL